MKIKSNLMLILSFVIFLGLYLIFFIDFNDKQINIKVEDLVNQQRYKKAVYIFKWKDLEKTVVDDHLNITKIYGYVKEKINVAIKNDILTVTLNRCGVILKTDIDSMDIGKNCTKVHGYMGVFTSSDNFYVSKDGEFEIVDYKPCTHYK